MDLFPTFAAPEVEVVQEVANPEYKNGLYFDFETGDLRISGSGKIIEANERDAWLQWCVKSILTQFNAYLSYSDAYGADMIHALSRDGREAKEEAIEQEIKNALLNDPSNRTVEVSGFSYSWDVDSVRVEFTVLGADGYTGQLTVSLAG